MLPVISALLACVAGLFRSRASLCLEHLALRHQLPVYQQTVDRPRLRDNHVQDLVALDFFVVPTVTCKLLFVLVILAHHRRRVVHFNVTEHPTAEWTTQQVVDAFPWDEAPRYLLRDRDRIYSALFRQRVRHMGIEEVITAPRSPLQKPDVERLIGSIRRECLDHVIVLHKRPLRRLLTGYLHYDHYWRTHRALDMDCPVPRTVQRPEVGLIKEVPEMGGLHHHDERRAA